MDAECGFHTDPNGSYLLCLNGPTILVDIGFDPAFNPSTSTIPVAAITNMPALVDTGAAESFIDTAIATALALPIVDKEIISGSAGSHEVDVYLAQICVPALAFTIWGRFAGVNLVAGGQTHAALIGRTFLQNVVMHYDGLTGRVTLPRTPNPAPAAPAAPARAAPTNPPI